MIDRACISLNAKCNLKCVYCHFATKKNNENTIKNEFKSDEVIVLCKNLLSYIKKSGLDSFKLGIVGAGEPLLSFYQIEIIVDFFKKSEIKHIIKMYVVSNGTLLNNEIIDFFYINRDIIELNISLDGDYEINRKLRGSFPDFDIYKNKFNHMPKINAVVTKTIIANQDRILNYFIENRFDRVNFSIVFGISNQEMAVNKEEYQKFLEKAQSLGITSRQITDSEKYDCTKYGRLCGVGKTNIFITKTGIYPCGRFMDNQTYKIGDWNQSLFDVEHDMMKYTPCPKGECFYEYHKVGD